MDQLIVDAWQDFLKGPHVLEYTSFVMMAPDRTGKNIKAYTCREEFTYQLAYNNKLGTGRNKKVPIYITVVDRGTRRAPAAVRRAIRYVVEKERAGGIKRTTTAERLAKKGSYHLYKVNPSDNWFRSFAHMSLFLLMVRSIFLLGHVQSYKKEGEEEISARILAHMPYTTSKNSISISVPDIIDIFCSDKYAPRLTSRYGSTRPGSMWRKLHPPSPWDPITHVVEGIATSVRGAVCRMVIKNIVETGLPRLAAAQRKELTCITSQSLQAETHKQIEHFYSVLKKLIRQLQQGGVRRSRKLDELLFTVRTYTCSTNEVNVKQIKELGSILDDTAASRKEMAR